MPDIDTTGRQVIRLERNLDHSIERVWEALTDPAQLGQWYPLRVQELDLRIGGRIVFDDGEGAVYQGEIRALERPLVFSFSEEHDLVHIELRARGSGCLMIFTHVFDDPSIAESTRTGWAGCLTELESLLNRG